MPNRIFSHRKSTGRLPAAAAGEEPAAPAPGEAATAAQAPGDDAAAGEEATRARAKKQKEAEDLARAQDIFGTG